MSAHLIPLNEILEGECALLEGNFKERLMEIESYLEFLRKVEDSVKNGDVMLGGCVVDTMQRNILYSSFYVHIYNLVESTVNQCIDGVSRSVMMTGCFPVELSKELLVEWVKNIIGANKDLAFEAKLQYGLNMVECLAGNMPIDSFVIDKGNGGNWDDYEIEKMAKRIGVMLTIDEKNIKYPIVSGLGALQYVKFLRNKLAHGEESFALWGNQVTFGDLINIKERVVDYLDQLVNSFVHYIKYKGFLKH